MARKPISDYYKAKEPISVFDWVSSGQTIDVFDEVTIADSVLELVDVGSEPEGYVPGGGRCVKLHNIGAGNRAMLSGFRTSIDLTDENTIIEFAVYYPDEFVVPAAGVDFYLCTAWTGNRFNKAFYPGGDRPRKGWNTYTFPLTVNAYPTGRDQVIGMGQTGTPDATDLDYFRIALEDQSNPGATHVYIGPITARRRASTRVTMSFDDGLESVYDTALPLMDARGLKGSAAIITDDIGDAGKMTQAEILELQNTYGWTIMSHSVSHPNFMLDALSEAELEAEVKDSVNALRAMGCIIKHFAWPGGAYTETTKSYCREVGIKMCWEIGQDFDAIPWADGTGDYAAHSRMPVETTAEVAAAEHYLDEAIRLGKHIHFYFHKVTSDPGASGSNTNTTEFTAFLDTLKSKQDLGQITVVTPGEYYDGLT